MPLLISPHFSLSELTRTGTGLPNEPDASARRRLALLCVEVLEPLRELWGDGPIKVNSGYRSVEVNEAIGGAKGSQHLRGEAADIVPPPYYSAEQAMMLLEGAVWRGEFPALGQAIIYASGFIHVSVDLADKPRRQLLRSEAAGGSGGPYHPYKAGK